MLRALFYAYVLGGITFIPLVVAAAIFYSIYTAVPVTHPVRTPNVVKGIQRLTEVDGIEAEKPLEDISASLETNDLPRTRKGWLTMRRTFEESAGDSGYVTLVRSFLDARSKDPKKSRPKDMWYVVLKGKVLYLYEDEDMTECEAAVELGGHQVIIYPEGLPDGELFARRNAICLRPKRASASDIREGPVDEERKDIANEVLSDSSSPWYMFVRATTDMEDWYLALIHASEQLLHTPTLAPLYAIFQAADMNHLVSTLDEQPDVIPMRWLNAFLGRIFFSHYRTHNLEQFIIGRLMKKLSKVKRPAFLTEIAVTEVSVGNQVPMLSKPMLKELSKEGDASFEVHLHYKGEIRLTVEATAVINLGARFKSYTVKLVLAAVLKELEGNLLIKVKRPPSNRIWYAFTQTPRMVLEVEPIVSDRQLTWGMILSTIESKFREIIQDSVVMPNMDDISFFESGGYEHRGGIWSDTARKSRSQPKAAVSTDDVQSVASAPLPDTGVSGFPEYIAPVVSKSMDDVNFVVTSPSTNANATADKPPLTVPTVLEEPSDSSHTPDSSRNSTRRRTWFSSVPADDSSLLPSSNIVADVNQPEALETRGRPTENVEPLRLSRSNSSYSSKSEGARAVTPDRFEDEHESSRSTYLFSHSSRRSSSQHSVKLEQGSSNQETPILQARSTPTTPSRNSDTSQIGRSPSPPSFFSTLKSKAADKQAISNTAKEAMRKWGVNWTGFIKKDTVPDEGSGSNSPPRLGPPLEDGFAHKSYAEVRAAVAERKERERTAQVDDSPDTPRSPSPSATDKPARTRILSNSTFPNEPVCSDTPNNSSIATPVARFSAPRLSSKKSMTSLVNAELDVEELPATEEPVKSPPIHVQPQAKTMSIPGIHASHRGEVQSMGYVAPQLQPTPAGPSENMLKNPAIQSVYRLWKTPSSSTGPETETRPLSGDSLGAVTVMLPPTQPSVKPIPPPLPPRSSAMAIPRTGSDTSADAFSPPSSSASQALKTIVLKDERIRRASIEVALTVPLPELAIQVPSNPVQTLDQDFPSQTVTQGSTPPPLPPRRTQPIF